MADAPAGSPDKLQQAIDELFSADPDEFMKRRAALAAAAKVSGDATAGKQITALRKPTRSAFTVNQLARAEPDLIAELVELGEQLRSAEKSVDPKQIRELTRQRRRLVDALTRRAFEVVEESAPSSAVRDEVVSTLTAALADEDVAQQVADGVLVKPARWEGFGFGGSPDLTLVGGSSGGITGAGGRRRESTRPTATSQPKPAARKGLSKQERDAERERAAAAEEQRKAQAKAEAEQAKQDRIEAAQQAADDAEEAFLIATDEEQTRVDRLRELEEQVADARKAVDEARITLRRAEIRQRRTRDALDRINR
ncbi:MAG: hypothetical protein ABWZ02_02295 [Nakamurella sp.]